MTNNTEYSFWDKNQTFKNATIDQKNDGEVVYLSFHFVFDEDEIVPHPIRFSLSVPGVSSVFYPLKKDPHISPNWGIYQSESSFTYGMPLILGLNEKDQSVLSLALSDTKLPASLGMGYSEETHKLEIEVIFFFKPVMKMKEYTVTLRMDFSKEDYFEAISKIKTWWYEKCGCIQNKEVPCEAEDLVYSTWYNFHQNLFQNELEEECKLATKYGFKTLIIDDGWQTEDNNRGYAFCGDWEIAKSRFPDFGAFVQKLHSFGMKVMVWYSVSLLGTKAKRYEELKDMTLEYSQGLQASILDPRYKEVRDYIISNYVRMLKNYEIDGLKLDFIDCFTTNSKTPKYNKNMDVESVEEGAALLFLEIESTLKKINPKLLIEYRQAYISPNLANTANMLRVLDCPHDYLTNIREALRLRYVVDIPIHSDMVELRREDSSIQKAYNLFATMFSVPQISLILKNLNREEEQILKHFLSFYFAHKETLLHGKIEANKPNFGVSKAISTLNGDYVEALLTDKSVVVLPDAKEVNIINMTGENLILVDANDSSLQSMTLYNPLGEIVYSGKIKSRIEEMNVLRIQLRKT